MFDKALKRQGGGCLPTLISQFGMTVVDATSLCEEVGSRSYNLLPITATYTIPAYSLTYGGAQALIVIGQNDKAP